MEPTTHSLSKPPLLNGTSAEQTRQQIRTYFLETWSVYESLFDVIADDEGYYVRAEVLRHPLIFYFGHTAVFFVNKLVLGNYLKDRVDQAIESTCAVGVDEMSWDDLNPNNYQWPTVQQVRDYRDTVKSIVLSIIDEMPLTLPITQDSLAWVILMGIEHERIHLETSSVIIRMLDLKHINPSSHWSACKVMSNTAPSNSLITVPKADIMLGKRDTNASYGWDNEYGQLAVSVDTFDASEMLVSNAEFMTFIEDGGYSNPEWWTSEGQQWLAYTQAKMPRFWLSRNNEYYQRNLSQEIPLPLNWPVEVNYLEAKAFCQWKSEKTGTHIRLPVEAEWQCLRDTLETDLPYWRRAPGNINLEHHASSCPVDQHKQGQFYDIIGNVWQWTESPIDGYPGFKVHPLYDDFSTPTFDGKHNLIKGGSWISTGNEAMRDSRYAFRRHFTQHAGFRYVRSDSATVPITPVNECETQTEISQLLYHHFPGKFASPHSEFEALSELCKQYSDKQSKVLDMGCGGGRLSFELANHFDAVDGIDFTARHIQHCLRLKEQGLIRFATPQIGDLVDYHDVSLQAYGYQAITNKVNFAQGDGHNLKPQFDQYDAIICHDVLEHTYTPTAFLTGLLNRLVSGGVLILGSAYQWQLHNDPAMWLGGYKDNGENVDTLAHIKERFAESMSLVAEHEVTRSYTINKRSKQVSDMAVSIWKKH